METFTGLPVQELEDMGGRNSTVLMQTSFPGLIRRLGSQCSQGSGITIGCSFLERKENVPANTDTGGRDLWYLSNTETVYHRLGNNCGIKTFYNPTWRLDYDSMQHISSWVPLEFSLSSWDEDGRWHPASAVGPDPPENPPHASSKHGALTLCSVPAFCYRQKATQWSNTLLMRSLAVKCGLRANMALSYSQSLSFRDAHFHGSHRHKPHCKFQFSLNLITYS